MAIIDIMAERQIKEPTKRGSRPLASKRPLKSQRLTKTQLRQAVRPPEAGESTEKGEVLDFYPDVHEAVEDILFDISQEPLLRDPRLDD